mmetsp:Transcript_19987/g.23952  ORF Transcript_19987/g.23952 Transcript_19987/m.23952 type:complete len:331 (+) Transcript_19987:83-1075(+)
MRNKWAHQCAKCAFYVYCLVLGLHQDICKRGTNSNTDADRNQWHSISGRCIACHHLCEGKAVVRVCILECVKQAGLDLVRGLCTVFNLRVGTPVNDGREGNASTEECSTKAVLLHCLSEPVHALSKCLEWGCRCVDSIVSSVGDLLQPKLLPLRHDQPPHAISWGVSRVCRSENGASEISPGQVLGVPFDNVVVDASAGKDKLRPHGHEEAVENVDVLDKTAVETATKLDQLVSLLCLSPLLVELLRVHTELCTAVNCVVHDALVESCLPVKAELSLELFCRHIQLMGLEQSCLGGNSIVVLIDQLILVDLLSGDRALALDLEALSLEPA